MSRPCWQLLKPAGKSLMLLLESLFSEGWWGSRGWGRIGSASGLGININGCFLGDNCRGCPGFLKEPESRVKPSKDLGSLFTYLTWLEHTIEVWCLDDHNQVDVLQLLLLGLSLSAFLNFLLFRVCACPSCDFLGDGLDDSATDVSLSRMDFSVERISWLLWCHGVIMLSETQSIWPVIRSSIYCRFPRGWDHFLETGHTQLRDHLERIHALKGLSWEGWGVITWRLTLSEHNWSQALFQLYASSLELCPDGQGACQQSVILLYCN